MRRFDRTILATAGVLLAFALLSPSSQAGVWEVFYDLAPGSSITTTTPLGPDTDPVTGTFMVEYDAASTAAPLTGARLMSGAFHVTISQMAMTPGVLTITGETDTVLSPPASGLPGTLTGDTLILPPVPDSSSTGFIHCTGAACRLAGLPPSMMIPQTPTGPGPFPVTFNGWVFTSGTAGVGDWTAPTFSFMTMTPMGLSVTVAQDFVGREVSRMFLPEPGTGAILASGTVLLAFLHRHRSRRQRRA